MELVELWAVRRVKAARRTGGKVLDLADLMLEVLPPQIYRLQQLQVLNLNSNWLTNFPHKLTSLRQLTELSLDYNPFTELPDAIGDLTGLTYLSVRGFRLERFPEPLCRLVNLTHLDLGGNTPSYVPEKIEKLVNLTYLDIGGADESGWSRPPGRVNALPQRRTGRWLLKRTPGRFRDFIPVAFSAHARGLKDLPVEVCALTKLTHLDISGHNLTRLPAQIGRLTELTHLNLRGNQLTSLPAEVGRLTKLVHLDVAGNNLTHLPEFLGRLPSLRTLRVEENPLVNPPPEVVEAGERAVLTFLRASSHGTTRQWAGKVVVVGEGAAGKTSVAKALSGLPHDPAEPSTHGLRVTDLALSHPRESGVSMALSLWDFGGQDIYHATHQFFLTDRSLFLLVWNSRVGEGPARLRYWLDVTTARAPSAPILLVATHSTGRPPDIDLDGLRAAYPQLVEVFPVECPTREGVPALREAVAEHASRLPLMGMDWPASWAKGATALAGHTSPYVDVPRLRRLLAEAGVGDAGEQDVLAQAMHHRGQILHFADVPELADTVVLRPELLNTQIAALLDHPEVAAQAGLVTPAALQRAWPGLGRAEREFLLAMMQRFDLSYRIRDGQDVALIVGRLPQRAAAYQRAWDAHDSAPEIRIRYQLSVLPPGIPGWFLAREHRFATAHRWRYGALLRHPDGRHVGLLTADQARSTVDLAVRGPLPATFFGVLDDGLNVTLARYPGLDVTRQVPCAGHGGAACPKLFDYARLTQRLEAGRTEIECDEADPGTDPMVDIQAMLLGINPPLRPSGTLSTLLTYARENQVQLQRTQSLVRALAQDHCPSVFTLVPARRRFAKTTYKLRLYCEEPGVWHPLPGDAGCYEITELAEWLSKAAPYIQRTLKGLRAALPYAGSVLSMAAHEIDAQLEKDIGETRKLLEQYLPDHLGYLDAQDAPDLVTPATPTRRASNDAEFREVLALLVDLDPRRHWGGLSYTPTPEGTSLYLCADHRAAYA